MGYTLDYFVADLRCPRCDAVTPADAVEIVTHIRRDPQLENLRVGDRIEMDPRPEDCGYFALHAPAPGEPVHLLDAWGCKSCGYWPNWAEIVIDHGVITSIEAVELDEATIERVHYATDDAMTDIQERTGLSYTQLRNRPRTAPASAEALQLSQRGRLPIADAAALLDAEPRLSEEERAFLKQLRADVLAGLSLSEPQVERLHLIAQHLP